MAAHIEKADIVAGNAQLTGKLGLVGSGGRAPQVHVENRQILKRHRRHSQTTVADGGDDCMQTRNVAMGMQGQSPPLITGIRPRIGVCP